jgi:hypothetical protein
MAPAKTDSPGKDSPRAARRWQLHLLGQAIVTDVIFGRREPPTSISDVLPPTETECVNDLSRSQSSSQRHVTSKGVVARAAGLAAFTVTLFVPVSNHGRL